MNNLIDGYLLSINPDNLYKSGKSKNIIKYRKVKLNFVEKIIEGKDKSVYKFNKRVVKLNKPFYDYPQYCMYCLNLNDDTIETLLNSVLKNIQSGINYHEKINKEHLKFIKQLEKKYNFFKNNSNELVESLEE